MAEGHILVIAGIDGQLRAERYAPSMGTAETAPGISGMSVIAVIAVNRPSGRNLVNSCGRPEVERP